jgi:hypothetical protein
MSGPSQPRTPQCSNQGLALSECAFRYWSEDDDSKAERFNYEPRD